MGADLGHIEPSPTAEPMVASMTPSSSTNVPTFHAPLVCRNSTTVTATFGRTCLATKRLTCLELYPRRSYQFSYEHAHGPHGLTQLRRILAQPHDAASSRVWG